MVQREEVVSWPPQSGVFLTEVCGLFDPFSSLRVVHHAHLTGVSVRILGITTPTPRYPPMSQHPLCLQSSTLSFLSISQGLNEDSSLTG